MAPIPSLVRRLTRRRALIHSWRSPRHREHAPIIPIADARTDPSVLHAGMGPLR